MAAITPTLGTINPVGDHTVVTGKFTGVVAASHIALVPTTGYVLGCTITTPAEDAATPQCVLNATTGGTATNGTIRVSTTADSGTYTFIAHVVGAI